MRRYSNRRWVVGSLIAFAVFALTTNADEQKPSSSGYFSSGGLPDLTNVLPPAPAAGDLRDEADRAIFRSTRSMDGSARWALARQDNDLSVNGILRAFACSLGLNLTSKDAPRLADLIARISVDSNVVDGVLKDQYKRKRPFLIQDGPICISKSLSLANSFDYPSGHTTLGWLTGLVLAEIMPSHEGPILSRARAYGESRIVCGVHNASAVEEGRTLGAAIFAALSALPEFRRDLDNVKIELAGLEKQMSATDTKACSTERALVTERVDGTTK